MVGNQYWSTGITIHDHGDGARWGATLEFLDDGFVSFESTEGKLTLRYVVDDLLAGVETLVADARRLGIRMGAPGSPNHTPTVYCDGDGTDEDGVDRPEWRLKAREVAEHLGWYSSYSSQAREDHAKTTSLLPRRKSMSEVVLEELGYEKVGETSIEEVVRDG